MKELANIAAALSDENRLRALAALQQGELCLCQLIALLQLAPSTVSRHMELLHQAGLVTRRKEGRWHYFQLADRQASPRVRQALRWCLAHLAENDAPIQDQQRLKQLRRLTLEEVCACYR